MYSCNDDLPASVKKKIKTKRGQEMWRRVVNAQKGRGVSDEVATASAWSALENAGYVEKDGVYVRKAYNRDPVYGYRPVYNAEDIIAWAVSQGFTSTLDKDDMHVTVVYSRTPFMEIENYDDDYYIYPYSNYVSRGGKRSVAPLGDKGAVVLKLDDLNLIQEWLDYRRMGASHDYEAYIPHVTITYTGAPPDFSKVEPYMGDIVFGPIQFEPLTEMKEEYFTKSFEDMLWGYLCGLHVCAILSGTNQENGDSEDEGDEEDEVSMEVKVLKSDTEQRIAWGWASVATEKGQPIYDAHGDYISMDEIVPATNEFMKGSRTLKRQHSGGAIGQVIHSLPLTKELAEALGIETEKEGWITGTYFSDDESWGKVKSGELPAFSIGGKGRRIVEE
jgi:cation transport regulator ChaB